MTYCTPEDLALYAGDLAVELRTDDVEAAAGVAQAIERASADLEMYCFRYDPVSLAANAWAKSKCLTLALWFLCGRRLNGRPDAVAEEYAEAKEQLLLVQQGKARVPNAPQGKGSVPTLTQQRVDLQRFPGLRTQRPLSTGKAEGYPQRTDPSADSIQRG